MSPRRRNGRDNSPWSSKRSRSRSYSPARRYRRSPRNGSRKRSRSRDKYNKRDQTSSSYRADYGSNKGISSSRVPVPPPPTVHSIQASAYNPVPEPAYGGYNQYSAMQTDYSQNVMNQQFNMAYPPPPSWNTNTTETHVMAAPPPWPVVPPLPTTIHQMQPVPPAVIMKDSDVATREAAVALEIQNQREELKRQRSDYLKKSETMRKELKMLKDQMVDLIGSGDAPPSPTTKGYINENEKLQGQIQKKINTIENVLDMLNGIIGEDEKKEVVSEKPKTESTDSSASSSSSSSSSESDDDSSPERLKTKVIESMKSRKESLKLEEKKKEKSLAVAEAKVNFVFYDPEMNWCQVCNVFPKSAKDYLNHMHSKEHTDKVEVPSTPWHDDFRNDEFPQTENAQTKRVPIRGLQFFVPARAWFCKLCKVWMGDLHCASSHLKSRTHSGKYDEFFQKNFTFEVDWMAQRQKALDKAARLKSPIAKKLSQAEQIFDNIPLKIGNLKNSDEKHSKSKKSDSKKSKSKKKRSKKHKKGSSSSNSSSSTSDSESAQTKDDKSASIRVAMRNIKKPEEEEIKDDLTTKGGYNPMEVDETEKKKDDLMMTQWNNPQPIISESEKKLFEQLKGKLKNKSHEEPNKKEMDSKRSSGRDNRKRSPVKDRSPVSKTRGNRSRSRERYRGRIDRRSRSPNRYNRRSRDRRSRSRRRNGSRGRSPYHWRNNRRSVSRRRWSSSKSKSRSRSRSSSNSRRSSRVEKPSVRYPEFRPRIPENETKRRSDREKKLAGTQDAEDVDRKKSPSGSTNSKKTGAPPPSYSGGKKLPFIGRMPVLAKKQQEQSNDNSGTEMNENSMNELGDPKSMEYAQYDNDGIYYDDLMPDPMAYATLMGGVPPPPPPPIHVVDEKEILPPGIDEVERDSIPKPISEAPAPRKGPLPRDFEEALNIIFPGETKVDKMDLPLEMKIRLPAAEAPLPDGTIVAATTVEQNENSEKSSVESAQINLQEIEIPPPIPSSDKTIEHSLAELDGIYLENRQAMKIKLKPKSTLLTSNTMDLLEELSSKKKLVENVPTPPAEKPSENDSENSKDLPQLPPLPPSPAPTPVPEPEPEPIEKEWRPQELDDLAMLGIDADDLAAQCI